MRLKKILKTLIVTIAFNALHSEVNIAVDGTGIIGVHDGADYGTTGTAYTNHWRKWMNGTFLNNGNTNDAVDTWNGDVAAHSSFPNSYAGIIWAAARTDYIKSVKIVLNASGNGGWFGTDSVSTLEPLEPILQATINGGTTWMTIGQTNDYTTQLTGQAVNAGALPVVTFNLNIPLTSINGLRIIGRDGGVADSDTEGYLSVREIEVMAVTTLDSSEKSIASEGTGIVGIHDGKNNLSTLGTAYTNHWKSAKPETIIDGNTSTGVDTWNGDVAAHSSFSHSYAGVLWSSARTKNIKNFKITLYRHSDGGWFGEKNNTVTAIAPVLQTTTDGGTTWTSMKDEDQSNDYTTQITNIANNTPFPTVTFSLKTPVTNINGIRIIGADGGSGEFLSVREVDVFEAVSASSQTLPTYDVTVVDLLKEMVNREVKTLFPDNYKTKQFSSYDRRADDPTNSDGQWYSNDDRTRFLALETDKGRNEYVMVDHDGPGAIVRWWMTFQNADANTKATLRIYLDGSDTPAIEGHPMDILSRGDLVGAPLASSSAPETTEYQRGHNLYLPIPYANGCKVTIEYEGLSGLDSTGKASGPWVYYNINYRDYDDNVSMQSFTKGELNIRPTLVNNVNTELLNAAPASLPAADSLTDTLLPEETDTLTVNGAKAIKKLTVKLTADDMNQALRSTLLSITFDGKETVWMPVGEFFGTGYVLSPYKSRYTEVLADGTVSTSWVMPFETSAEVSLTNYGTQNVTYTLDVVSEDYTWVTDSSLYFHAKWQEYNKLTLPDGSRGGEDKNYVTVTGKGVYVGDSLTIFNARFNGKVGNAGNWWGEGDEKIFVDDEIFPSHFGTGTEDYYGYAWCLEPAFHTPFVTQPIGEGNLGIGVSVNSRYRMLDDIPFDSSIQFDMEVLLQNAGTINFSPAVFYYAEKSSTDNITNDLTYVRHNIALSLADLYATPVSKQSPSAEGEYMSVESITTGTAIAQTSSSYGWSNNQQMWWYGASSNDELQLKFSASEGISGDFKIVLTTAKDYGIFDIYLNNVLLETGVDLYSSNVSASTRTYSSKTLVQGDNTLKVVQKGRNSSSTDTMFGIDMIEVENPTLTPAIGLKVCLTDNELIWTAEEEIGVKEYRILVDGELFDTVNAVKAEFYNLEVPANTEVRLVVVDQSGFLKTYFPQNGNDVVEVYDLKEGWNLIAITSNNADIETLKNETVGVIWGWDGMSYKVVESPQPTDAVWVYSPIAKQVYVSGTRSSAKIMLSIGWNMVGPVENAYIPEGTDTVYSWSKVYDVIAGEEKVLVGGKGYWIFSL